MLELKADRVEEYLLGVYKDGVKVLRVVPLGGEGLKDLKGFGYGAPYSIEFSVDGEAKHVILETIRPGSFGHDYFSDRATVLRWQHSAFNTFNNLPKHVRSVDVGAFMSDGESLRSLGDCREFFHFD